MSSTQVELLSARMLDSCRIILSHPPFEALYESLRGDFELLISLVGNLDYRPLAVLTCQYQASGSRAERAA